MNGDATARLAHTTTKHPNSNTEKSERCTKATKI
jgi:hypothetical protein